MLANSGGLKVEILFKLGGILFGGPLKLATYCNLPSNLSLVIPDIGRCLLSLEEGGKVILRRFCTKVNAPRYCNLQVIKNYPKFADLVGISADGQITLVSHSRDGCLS